MRARASLRRINLLFCGSRHPNIAPEDPVRFLPDDPGDLALAAPSPRWAGVNVQFPGLEVDIRHLYTCLEIRQHLDQAENRN
jgi:hypothetical protein